MVVQTHLEGKPLTVHFSKKAEKEMNDNAAPLYIGMELYFSCLIRKRVRFKREIPPVPTACIQDNLHVFFRPVQSKSCNILDLQGANSPELIDLEIKKRQAIIPKHLHLDFKKGQWKGEFEMTKISHITS